MAFNKDQYAKTLEPVTADQTVSTILSVYEADLYLITTHRITAKLM